MQQEYTSKGAPNIEIIESTSGNDSGDVVKVRMVTDGEIYYYDGNRRWCFWYLNEEAKYWRWVKRPQY